jgi:hypothetical protein
MGSLVAYGFLAYLLTRITPAHFPRRAAIALLAGLVLLIGFSRIYLGVHFMSDKMTPPEVFLGRSEWQGSWNRLRMEHLPREAIYSWMY